MRDEGRNKESVKFEKGSLKSRWPITYEFKFSILF